MGLLFAENKSKSDFKSKTEDAWLQQLGCKACPLNPTPGKVDAAGSSEPEIYILGESFEKREAQDREHFSGNAGELLRSLLPKRALPLIRWNNVINCHPTGPGHRKPTSIELSCCKPRVVADIERTRPRVIWGFGDGPLRWASGFTGASGGAYWRGRRMPVKIGDHVCWYYAFLDPFDIHKKSRDFDPEFGSEDERMTCFDLERAFADLDDLPKPVVHSEAQARANVECITDIGQITKALQWASRLPGVGLDYETSCKRPYEEGAKILTASVGTLERSFAFPIHHPGADYSKRQVADILELWKRFLLRASCKKIVHQLSFEMEWSAYFFGREVLRVQKWEDTSNAASIIDERTGGKVRSGPFSLEFLVQQYFGFNVKALSDVDKSRLEFTPLETVLQYNGIDSKYHFGLWEKLWAEIEALGLTEAYYLSRRRVPTVVLSQLKGVPVDQEVARAFQGKYEGKIDEALEIIDDLVVVQKFKRQKGRVLNPQSSPDLLYVFHDLLGCPEILVEDKYSKKEKYSTEETVLNAIIKNQEGDAAELSKALILLREASGTKSKYVDALLYGEEKCVVYPDGLLHTNFNTYFAETGRLSSDGPNLQNFPKRDEETREVRKAVAAGPGDTMLAFDYGQIEARVIAMFTKDPVFVKALWENFDVHFEWAERIAYAYPTRVGGKRFLKDKKVMKDFRTDIKNQWTFPLFFGARDKSVANYLNIPIEVIKPQVREFWKIFSTTRTWQEKLLRFYKEYGYVETLTGRRRRGPLSTNQIYNSPVQGTAADIVLDAMCRLSETEEEILQPEINIHDDLTYCRVPLKKVDVVAERVIDTMINVPFKFTNVPIMVEMSIGKNWCELEEIGKYSSEDWNK